jgi:hypothetical protein
MPKKTLKIILEEAAKKNIVCPQINNEEIDDDGRKTLRSLMKQAAATRKVKEKMDTTINNDNTATS